MRRWDSNRVKPLSCSGYKEHFFNKMAGDMLLQAGRISVRSQCEVCSPGNYRMRSQWPISPLDMHKNMMICLLHHSKQEQVGSPFVLEVGISSVQAQ